MEHQAWSLPELLRLDSAAGMYFQTLDPALRAKLLREDEVRSFPELQARAVEEAAP